MAEHDGTGLFVKVINVAWAVRRDAPRKQNRTSNWADKQFRIADNSGAPRHGGDG